MNQDRIRQLEREAAEDRAAIRALNMVVETIKMQVGADYLARLACLADVTIHAATIARAHGVVPNG